jgi:hypothetical protein
MITWPAIVPTEDEDRPEARSEIAKTQLAAVLCIVALDGALLVAKNSFDGGVDVDSDPGILQTAQLPDSLAQHIGDLQDRFGLIDSQAVHVTPIGAGRRKPSEPEKAA